MTHILLALLVLGLPNLNQHSVNFCIPEELAQHAVVPVLLFQLSILLSKIVNTITVLLLVRNSTAVSPNELLIVPLELTDLQYKCNIS